ncbi:YdcF family protein [Oscillospiraceae bacterium HV4-5-C5C]|nr:YdcF family protein [Oscillospiraceae bacterium HV4-5-C5C]
MVFAICCLIFTALFLWSFFKERRRFRNAVLLFLSLLCLLLLILDFSGGTWLNRLLLLSVLIGLPAGLLLLSLTFAAAGVISIKRDGWSLAHFLSLAFSIGIWTSFFAACALVLIPGQPALLQALEELLLILALYILFTFLALFLYVLFYLYLPKNTACDYILVLGAGLQDGWAVTPLLAGRIKKALKVFRRAGSRPTIIVSGGQGEDERRPEAWAMREYLLRSGVAERQIVCEDRSRNTRENLQFCQQLMDRQRPQGYNCVFVTSDYHVFRTALLARQLKLKAQGVGSATALYYWPNAFVREYLAIMLRYKAAPVALLLLWLLLLCLT